MEIALQILILIIGFALLIKVVMLIFSSLLLRILASNNRKITKIEGILMLVIFSLYYGFITYGAFA